MCPIFPHRVAVNCTNTVYEVCIITLSILTAFTIWLTHDLQAACTTGVAIKSATVDGRPIAWHNEDLKTNGPFVTKNTHGYDNIVLSITGNGFLGALNEKGLARFINSQHTLGGFEGHALKSISQTCASLAEVRELLAGKSYTMGRSAPVIDAYGDGAMYEIGGPFRFWEYHPENPTRQKQTLFRSPNLFSVRSNRPFTNEDHQELEAVVSGWNHETSRKRYLRARDLFVEKINNTDRLTLKEVMEISRDGDPGFGVRSLCGIHTRWGAIAAGVKKGENPKYAVMLVALGNPDYSIYIPAWVDLSNDELSRHVRTWDANNIAWWSFRLLEEKFDETDSYDEFINNLFSSVESNIIEGVETARSQWLVHGNTGRFHNQAAILHDWSAKVAFETIKSAYETAGDGRECNQAPRITTLGYTANGLTVRFQSDAVDPDGGEIVTCNWNFGDGNSATGSASISHTFSKAGIYLVAQYVQDKQGASNVKFEFVTVEE